MDTRTHYSRQEAADVLNCSLRTVDRLFPPGTEGRTEGGTEAGRYNGVLIRADLVQAKVPAPGGDDVPAAE